MRTDTKALPATQAAFPARLLLPSYAATLFFSAGLLFLVQPMVTKMVLPRLGGSPSVWNTSMCFFQATLLCGYLYAHLLATRFERRAQALIHGAVLLAAAAFLPLDLTGATPPADGIPVLWLIGRLARRAGGALRARCRSGRDARPSRPAPPRRSSRSRRRRRCCSAGSRAPTIR